MKSKFLLLVGVLFAVGAVLSGCKDDPNENPYPDTLKQFSAEAASGTNAIGSNGGTRTIAFYSPVTWTAAVTTSDGGDWATIEPASGPVGTCSVSVIAAKNTSTSASRTATVTITAGSETLTYTVEQRYQLTFDVTNADSKAIYIPTEGETFVMKMDNNAGSIGYSVSISEADAKWITYNQSKAVVDNLSFTIEPVKDNYFGGTRSGSIVIKENNGGPGGVTIRVKQAGSKTMMVWPTATQSVDQILTDFDASKYQTLYLAGDKADASAIAALGQYVGGSVNKVDLTDAVATSIPDNAFKGKSGLQTVTINTKVTEIGSYAFAGTGMSSFTFPLTSKQVEVDGKKQTVDMPSNITVIKDYAFSGAKLTAIELPGLVKEVGDFAFAECKSLKTVTVAFSDWKDDGKYATKLVGLVEKIGEGAFKDCPSLSSVTLPDPEKAADGHLLTVGASAFAGDYTLAGAFTLPKTVTEIGASAFEKTAITSITLTAVTTMGDNVFNDCNALSSITSKTATPPAVSSTLGTLANANLTIKVPAAAVGTYKAATGWSVYEAKVTK